MASEEAVNWLHIDSQCERPRIRRFVAFYANVRPRLEYGSTHFHDPRRIDACLGDSTRDLNVPNRQTRDIVGLGARKRGIENVSL